MQPGSHNLTYSYSATSGSGTYLATKAAFEIPTTLTGATVECIRTTASVDGYIKLQGRLGTETVAQGLVQLDRHAHLRQRKLRQSCARALRVGAHQRPG